MYNQYPYGAFNPSNFSNINPSIATSPKGLGGLLGGIAKKGFTWDGFLTNTQKTLNVINQAMPIYNQVKPMFRNMGTVFRVIGELNRGNSANSANTTETNNNYSNSNVSTNNNPQFFA